MYLPIRQLMLFHHRFHYLELWRCPPKFSRLDELHSKDPPQLRHHSWLSHCAHHGSTCPSHGVPKSSERCRQSPDTRWYLRWFGGGLGKCRCPLSKGWLGHSDWQNLITVGIVDEYLRGIAEKSFCWGWRIKKLMIKKLSQIDWIKVVRMSFIWRWDVYMTMDITNISQSGSYNADFYSNQLRTGVPIWAPNRPLQVQQMIRSSRSMSSRQSQ